MIYTVATYVYYHVTLWKGPFFNVSVFATVEGPPISICAAIIIFKNCIAMFLVVVARLMVIDDTGCVGCVKYLPCVYIVVKHVTARYGAWL